MFRMGIRLALIFTAALLLTSCASSKRMMRLSPFSSKDSPKVNYDESHINLWPLFYNKGDFYSVFWPVIDSDPKGFAVRPLYNQDGHEYSILFPLCAWNPRKADGWVLNTYWNRKCIGSFPLFHLANKNKFNYILPVWWHKDLDAYGTFGVAFSDGLNFIGPLWFDKKAYSGGIFPIFYQKKNRKGWLFPLYNYENTKDKFYFNFLFGALGRFAYGSNLSHYRFLNAFSIDKGGRYYQGFLPLYYYERKGNEKLLLTPLGGREWNPETGDVSAYILNGFYINENKNSYHGIIPLYYYEREENQKLLVTPLGGRGWDAKTGDSSFVNVLGPLYFSTRNKRQNKKFESFCWPLYINSRNPREKNVASIPLFWYNRRKNDGFLNILGVAYHSYYNKKENFKSVCWPLYFNSRENKSKAIGSFPLFFYRRGEKEGMFNLLGPLYHHYYDNKKDKNSYLILWPLSFYSKKQNEINFGSFPLFWRNKDKDGGFLNILGPVFHHYYRKNENFYSVLWPLSFYSEKQNETTLGSFPLFWYNKGKNSGLLNILGLLWDYRWDKRSWRAGSILMLGGLKHKYYDDHILPGEDHSCRNIYRKYPVGKYALKEESSFNILPLYNNNKRKYTVWKIGADQEILNETSRMLQRLRQVNNDIKNHEKLLKNNISDKEFLSWRKHKTEERQINMEEVTALLKELNIPVLDLKDNNAIEKTRYAIHKEYCTTVESGRVVIPFLYTYDEFEGDYKWDVLWFLANGKKADSYEKISVLRYLYRYEKSGDVTSRVIFPFMTYKTAPQKSKFSFLWRVFDYKREKDKVSGHVLFIPF